jgi:hypothetical protein
MVEGVKLLLPIGATELLADGVEIAAGVEVDSLATASEPADIISRLSS